MDSKKDDAAQNRIQRQGTGMNAMHGEESLMQHTLLRFIKGTTVGLVASAMLQPLQVIKTSMQISPIHKIEAI